jgi:starch phosphorylase
MNGVINLSVLDGWWGEAYEGDNGWAIKPAAETLDQKLRNHEESRALYEILQDQVLPLYYRRGNLGHSTEWIRMAKCSIASILPRYNAERMVTEYRSRFYLRATQQHRRYADGDAAKMVAAWKMRVRAAWPGVTLQRIDRPLPRLTFGASMRIEVGVKLNGLAPGDIVVELELMRLITGTGRGKRQHHKLSPDGAPNDAGEQRYLLDLTPDLCGRLDYRIRAYPFHERLAHPFELGLMIWC